MNCVSQPRCHVTHCAQEPKMVLHVSYAAPCLISGQLFEKSCADKCCLCVPGQSTGTACALAGCDVTLSIYIMCSTVFIPILQQQDAYLISHKSFVSWFSPLASEPVFMCTDMFHLLHCRSWGRKAILRACKVLVTQVWGQVPQTIVLF